MVFFYYYFQFQFDVNGELSLGQCSDLEFAGGYVWGTFRFRRMSPIRVLQWEINFDECKWQTGWRKINVNGKLGGAKLM